MNCSAFESCGSCSLLKTDYPRQLELKKNELAGIFTSAGMNVTVHDVVGMDNPFHYRNKVISYLSFRNGRIVCGMYQESSHRITYTPSCLLQDSVLNHILSDTVRLLSVLKIRIDGYGGVLKNILLRRGVSTGQVMLVLVTSGRMFHGGRELVKQIVSLHPEIKTVIQNVNPRHTSVVLGDEEHLMYGNGYILDDLLGYRFKISSKSFYQVNHSQTEKLYTKAIELANLTGKEVILDAYCGIGTVGICASEKAGEIVGVEINRDAVEDARSNARAGKLRNASFFCDDVKDFMIGFEGKADVLILDPPRSGCDTDFLRAVTKMAPKRIVYISCDPHTQVRDLGYLKRFYNFTDAWPYDMFPHTQHVENIVGLSRI